ncbi:cytochrome P450 [Cercophora newfieldiana]|uniref:Cytochrome P450 n=1 Tax=Cercophora newfieldiana TaxID=92897 RepID=A0AA40CS56_9PEZI|nr:cytochrome P450 [Cercophora newfieldiana]
MTLESVTSGFHPIAVLLLMSFSTTVYYYHLEASKHALNPLPDTGALLLLLSTPPLINALIFLLLLTFYNLHLHPLSSFPDPLLHRALPLSYIPHTLLGTTAHSNAALHAKYGPVVRIAPNQLSYISIAAWRDIYGVRESSSSGKDTTGGGKQMIREELVFPGDDFEFFTPAKPMISCDAANHARHRRAVRSYEGMVSGLTRVLMGRLEEEQRRVDDVNSELGEKEKGEGINIVDWFHFAMFDVTSALVFGKPFGNPENGRYHDLPWSLAIAEVPGLGRLVSWFLPRKMVAEARRHMQFIVDMIDARSRAQLAGPPHQMDFMSYILPALQVPHGEKPTAASLSTEELYLNAQLLCIAGSETTASLLAGTVYFLSLEENAHHRARLVAELRGQFAAPEDMTPTTLAHEAPFLGAVLNECLRLYPPGAINMPRKVPAGGAMIDVPGGSVVGIAQFAACRSATHWIDPLRFAPERWLMEGEQAKYACDRKDVFRPFSHGPRNCAGQSLAVAECRLIVARLFSSHWAAAEHAVHVSRTRRRI